MAAIGGRSRPTQIFPIHIFTWPRRSRILVELDEARSAVKAGLTLNPAFAISPARASWTAISDDPTYLAQLEPVLEGLRKAGVPEQ